MNLNDKNIDKLFRDAANNSQSPEFHDAYWSEMEALIKQNQMAKKNRFLDLIWIVGGFSSLLFLLTIGLFMNPSAKTNNTIAEFNTENKDHQTYKEDVPSKKNNAIQSMNSFDENELEDGTNLNRMSINEDEYAKRENNDQFDKTSNDKNQNNRNNKEFNNTHSNEWKQKNEPISRGHSTGGFENKSSSSTDEVGENPELAKESDERVFLQPIRLSPKLVQLSNEFASTEDLFLMGTRRIRPEHGFSLDAGLSFAEPYQGTSSSSNRFSFAAMYNLDYNNLILRTGIGVTVERSSNLSVREESMVYSYESTKYEHVLDYKMFTEIYVPLEIGYRFNNTTFGAGGQINMLVGTRMNHTEKINDQVIQNRMLNNRTEGLSTFTGGAYLWIQQHLNARLMAGVRIGKNIGSRIDATDYLHSVSRPSPIFGQVYVSYQIFKK